MTLAVMQRHSHSGAPLEPPELLSGQGVDGMPLSDAVMRRPMALQHPKIAKFWGVLRPTPPWTRQSPKTVCPVGLL